MRCPSKLDCIHSCRVFVAAAGAHKTRDSSTALMSAEHTCTTPRSYTVRRPARRELPLLQPSAYHLPLQ